MYLFCETNNLIELLGLTSLSKLRRCIFSAAASAPSCGAHLRYIVQGALSEIFGRTPPPVSLNTPSAAATRGTVRVLLSRTSDAKTLFCPCVMNPSGATFFLFCFIFLN